MNTKDQAKKYGVCDLEYAQELERLGFKQKSLWWWAKANLVDAKKEDYFIVDNKYMLPAECSAPTVAELGERLPRGHRSYLDRDIWVCESGDGLYWERADTEANARAKMLIYLKKNGLLK